MVVGTEHFVKSHGVAGPVKTHFAPFNTMCKQPRDSSCSIGVILQQTLMSKGQNGQGTIHFLNVGLFDNLEWCFLALKYSS